MSSSDLTTARFDALDRIRRLREAGTDGSTSPSLSVDPTTLDAAPIAQESTAVRRIDTRSPGGSGLIVDPETGERRSVLAPHGKIEERLAAIRETRDRLLGETFANNPLQKLAAPALSATGDALRRVNVFDRADGTEINALDVLENIGKGAALGSVLLPDDAAIEPENPMPALQLASTFIGAGAEGFSVDFGILRGLSMVRASAAARNAPNLARSADRALNLFGQGESLSRMRQVVGGAALAATSEVAMRTAMAEDPGAIIENAGLVAVGGAALGGAVATVGTAARAARAAPRALRSFSEEFADRASAEVQEIMRRGGDAGEMRAALVKKTAEEQGLFAATSKQGVNEGGLRPRTAYIERVEDQARRSQIARSLREAPKGTISETAGRTQSPKIETMFDEGDTRSFIERFQDGLSRAREDLADAFDFDARLGKLPSTTGHPELSAADDYRVMRHRITRSDRLAEEDIGQIVAPLRQVPLPDVPAAWRMFERIIVLRDLAESSRKGLQLPLDISYDEITRELGRLEASAPREVLEAAENHRAIVDGWRRELIRRGSLEVGDGFDDYFPHQLIDDLSAEEARILGVDPEGRYPTSSALERGRLREPSRPYTRRREGSRRRVNTNYIEVMHRAARRFHADNGVQDYLDELADSALRLRRSELTKEELSGLLRRGAFVRGGTAYASFKPRGPAYYRTSAVDDEMYASLVNKIQDEIGIDVSDMPELRDVLAVGKPTEYILPKALVDKLDQFYAPDPLRLPALAPVRQAVAWWKRNTIFWGLSRFTVFQILGDGTNLARSNPAAFAQIRNNRIDSPLFRSIQTIFGRYGTPMISRTQIAGQLTGGIGGLTINEALNEDPSTAERAAAFLTGAGLGYIAGTRRVRGTAPNEGLRALYEEADRVAAINSGFVTSEENLAARLLGENAAAIPDQATPHWRRALDTAATFLSGKTFGNPFSVGRAAAETIEVFQRERENVMRLASYIQQVEQGVDPRVAGKRARESLIDYGKFTDFENKFIRGFALPFYAFHRHNIPNWIKAAAGKDIGGKPTVALAAVTALASFDVTTQLWNETFFPEIERSLDEFRRKQFHIILGNPATGEPLTDKRGNPMVVGWEMPYEQALEFFGLARPGYVFSELFGLGGLQNPDVSLVERAKKGAADAAMLKGPGQLALDLLNPFIKEGIQITANQDFFFDAPIVPSRYIGPEGFTDAGRERIHHHIFETFFRQYREFRRIGGQISGQRFDPLTSAVGLGLPIHRIDMNREIQGYLHEQIDQGAQAELEADDRWRSAIDDILYDRTDFERPEEGEMQRVLDEINALPRMTPTDIEQATRYYMSRGGKGGLARRWESLSSEEKVRVWNGLPEWAQTALTGYLNFGAEWYDEGAPGAGGGSGGGLGL